MSLNNGDLKGTIIPVISIDEFEPKAGEEQDVIVVAFYSGDQGPAEDLNTFIQRGHIETLDVEVSPNTDEEGRYLVFVEMERNSQFETRFKELVRDIENLTGKETWQIRTYLSAGDMYELSDPELFKFVITDPERYVTKGKFMKTTMQESVKEFFSDTLVSNLTLDQSKIIIEANGRIIVATVEDAGPYDQIIGRNFLGESAYRLGNIPYEAKLLESMLGNAQVLPLGKFLCLSKGENVILLKDTYIDYKA